MRWVPIIVLSTAALLTSCTHAIAGDAAAPSAVEKLYPVLPPRQADLEDRLLSASDVRAVADLTDVKTIPALETVLSTANTVSDCAYGYSLATRQQYLSFGAARIQAYAQTVGRVRRHTVGTALIVFETASSASQQFEQFAQRMSRCDGVHGVTSVGSIEERWTLSIVHSGQDEVNWTRSTDSSPWSCRLVARQRANYVASVMFCRLDPKDDKSEAMFTLLLDKLSR
ncbi:sensor domain-containing protein [Mycobacteroides saopaulense]|uniref:Sensor domain-containing protein n=1 Tax=Mycobacteroides saopaulense TaxID=1578165 RepID=A0ABX3C1V3_9MYCO|nr:sensor domain-containing protein [Mycobacteroides saopaulense]OHT84925.1 sensor domain-containing protein [Mycobacteroides saopaulense]OHU11077.1 sensor domain-containing protein [Mycobacteroides saopaulense]